MKTGKRRKGSGVFLLLVVMLFALSLNAQAATKAKAGVYKKTYSVSGSFACGSVERFHQAAKLPLQTYEADFFHALSDMETLKATRCSKSGGKAKSA